MAKRKPAAAALTLPDEHRYRRQHGRVTRVREQIVDANGGIGLPYFGEGLLGLLERRGTIRRAQRDAGERFQTLFRRAHLDPLRAADMRQRIAGSAGYAYGGERAHRQVMVALDVLGGISSPAGSCAWFVLGCEMTIAEWARRESSGAPLRKEVAKGILIGTLSVLDALYSRGREKNG